MQLILDLINEGNWLGLLFAAGVLGYVGQAMLSRYPRLQRWGVRIAVVAFVLFTASRAFESGQPVTDDLVMAVLHGMLASALVIGPTWILLAVVAFLNDQREELLERFRRRQQRAIDQRRQRLREAENMRLEQDQATTHLENRQALMNEQRRRNTARGRAMRAFHLRKEKLDGRFSESDLKTYSEAFLADTQPADDVEYHARKLTQLLKQLAAGRHGDSDSFAVLNQQFERRMQEIAASPIDDELRDILIAELEEQFESDFRRIIREGRS